MNDTTINIDSAAQRIAAKSIGSDRFNTEQAVTAQLTEWFGPARGSLYLRVRAQLHQAVNHRISESYWRLNIVAQMDGE